MSENYRNPIASLNKFPQFTTMNVIDGQAGLVNYSSLIFYSLTIDNILNIIVLLILARSKYCDINWRKWDTNKSTGSIDTNKRSTGRRSYKFMEI